MPYGIFMNNEIPHKFLCDISLEGLGESPCVSSQVDHVTTDKTAHCVYSELAKLAKLPNSTNESDSLKLI